MTTTEDSGKITYSVRELLTEIKTTLSNIDAKLDNKAEKTVVEGIDKRLHTIESARTLEREYGNQIFSEYKELLKEHTQVKLDINSLQVNKKDKEAFNAFWIPLTFSTILSFVAIVSRFYTG